MKIIAIQNETMLLRQMQAGNEEAFTVIFRHYAPQLFLKAFTLLKDRLLAEEIVQEVFTRIWQKRERLDPEQNFSGWLSTITVNQVLDMFRKMKRDRLLQERFLYMQSKNYQHIDEFIDYRQSREILEKAVKELSPQQHKVYQLCQVEGYSYKETASELGISPITVKEYLVNANKVIRRYMKDRLDTGSALLLLVYIQLLTK